MRLVTKAPNQSKHLFCVQVFAFSPQMYVEHARHHQHMHDKGVHKQCLGSVISLNFLVAHCIFRPLTVANEGQSHMATTGACVGASYSIPGGTATQCLETPWTLARLIRGFGYDVADANGKGPFRPVPPSLC